MAYTHLFLLPLLAASLSQEHTGSEASISDPDQAPMYKTNDDVTSSYKTCTDPAYEPITSESDCRQMATDFIGGSFRSAGGHGHWPPGCFRYNGVNGNHVYLGTNSGGTGARGHVMVCKLKEPTPAPTPAPPTPAPTTAAQYFGSAECTVGEVCVSGSWATYYKDSTSEVCMERCAAGYHGIKGMGVGNCTHFTFGPDGTCVLYTQCTRGSGSIAIGSGGSQQVIADTSQFTTCNAPYSPPVTADWVLISSQDRRKAGFSSNARNTYLENEDNPEANTYMIVGKLTKDEWKTDGKYHFKMVYYTDSESDGDELEWTQTNWLTDQRVTGSEAISPDNLMRSQGCATFTGLAKCSGGQAVLDGDGYGTGCWWNCVGCVHSHGGGMPAWNSQIKKQYRLYIWGNPRSLA